MPCRHDMTVQDILYSPAQSAAFQALRDAEYRCWRETDHGGLDTCCCRAPDDGRRAGAIVAMIARQGHR